MPGPPKTPTAMLKAIGSKEPYRRGDEPEPEPEMVLPPPWLKKEYVPLWEDISAFLFSLNVLSKGDGVALFLLVDALGEYLTLTKMIDKQIKTMDDQEAGYMSVSDTGVARTHPLQTQRDHKWAMILKAAIQFGMTPASRADITRIEKKKTSTHGLKVGSTDYFFGPRPLRPKPQAG